MVKGIRKGGMKFGIVVFPGSNCDRDCFHVTNEVCRQEAVYLWHKDTDLKGCDCIILPGGFSYGDYLRAGAIASRSPIIKSVVDFAKKGGLVIGICNGFQVLTEMRLLPGALMPNSGLKFICSSVNLRVETSKTPFTSKYRAGDVVKIPIAHMDGCYFADDKTVKVLEDDDRILFRYCDEDGAVTITANPNGSIGNIAGICSEERNVAGMMPHPERVSEEILGGVDGRSLFESVVQFVESMRQ